MTLTNKELADLVANAVAQALISASKLESKEEEVKKEVKKTSKKTSIKKVIDERQGLELSDCTFDDCYCSQYVIDAFMVEQGTALPHKYRSFVAKENYSTYKMLCLIAKNRIDFDRNYKLSSGLTAGEALVELCKKSVIKGYFDIKDFLTVKETTETLVKCTDSSTDKNTSMVASKKSKYEIEDSKVLKQIAKLDMTHLSREDLLKLYDDQLTKLGL